MDNWNLDLNTLQRIKKVRKKGILKKRWGLPLQQCEQQPPKHNSLGQTGTEKHKGHNQVHPPTLKVLDNLLIEIKMII